jgi:hypothetical protein
VRVRYLYTVIWGRDDPIDALYHYGSDCFFSDVLSLSTPFLYIPRQSRLLSKIVSPGILSVYTIPIPVPIVEILNYNTGSPTSLSCKKVQLNTKHSSTDLLQSLKIAKNLWWHPVSVYPIPIFSHPDCWAKLFLLGRLVSTRETIEISCAGCRPQQQRWRLSAMALPFPTYPPGTTPVPPTLV